MVYSAKAEAAKTLPDVVFRRTALGNVGNPGKTVLERVARLLAQELGWSDQEIEYQLQATEERFLLR